MSHSMLNRKLLSAQARANAHPYAPNQHQQLSPSHAPAPGPGHSPSHARPTVAATGPGASPANQTAPVLPPVASAAAPAGPIPSYSYTAAALDQLAQHEVNTPYSTQSYPTVPLQTAKQRARSVKIAASARAAAAATAAAAAEVASTAASRVATMAAEDDSNNNQRRRSTISLEEMLSGDDEAGGSNPTALPYPSSFFDLDALSMASTSALMAENQFLAGNPALQGQSPMAPPPPPPPLSSSVGGGSAGPSPCGGARSNPSSMQSSARPAAPSSATHDRTLTSKSSSSASSSASAADSIYTDTQYQQRARHPSGSPTSYQQHRQQHHVTKRPSPSGASAQAQQVPRGHSASSSAEQTPYPAPPTHDTSTLGTASFYRLPTASELNLTAAAQSYQAQRAAYEYVPASTAVTGANAEEVLSVPFMPTISYLTNPEGDIVSVEDATWNAFMDKNNIHPFSPQVARCCFPQVMGRSLFEFLRDPKLARFTRHLLHMVSTGAQPSLTYHWFCDSPTVERKMVMSVSRLTGLSNQPVVLWSSKILWERDLPVPASYLALPATNDDPASTGAMPCCSYCKRVMVYLSDLTLTPELVASLMAGSPQGSPNVLNNNKVDERMGGDEVGGSGGALGEVGDLPDYEPNGLVPIFGLRGKRGYSLASVSKPVSHVYHGVCEVCWRELVSFFGI
ncbi:hypothetical protein BCR44DRAFT_1437582 [Catenaria anguillulae PL171]|uniref:Uncharacterized protein n=1 Tax=Catenaria anguillulae PL171 TaxID=765915 RepID=A0A1Y2HGU9_9FUNG|nr:hypothetical protein BCR44DRAFT_1437582 [Catenaria anguillulae PL171]